MALAFLEEKDISKAFAELKPISTVELLPFIEYVDEFYVNGKGGHQARYPPSLWSCFIENGHLGAKTQNYVESFHAQIGKVLAESHVGCWERLPSKS